MGFNEERRKNLIIAEDYQPNIYLLEAEESPAAVSLLGRSYVAVWVTGKIPAVSGLFVLSSTNFQSHVRLSILVARRPLPNPSSIHDGD